MIVQQTLEKGYAVKYKTAPLTQGTNLCVPVGLQTTCAQWPWTWYASWQHINIKGLGHTDRQGSLDKDGLHYGHNICKGISLDKKYVSI